MRFKSQEVEKPVFVNNGTVNALQSRFQGLGVIIFIQQSNSWNWYNIFFYLVPIYSAAVLALVLLRGEIRLGVLHAGQVPDHGRVWN